MRLKHIALVVLASLAMNGSIGPAFGQWQGPGEWGTPGNIQLIEPGTWMVSYSDAGSQRSVSASAQGMNYTGTLEFWCRRDDPAGGLMFWDFFGSALKIVPESHPEETDQDVVFDFDGQRFRLTFTYIPWERVWLEQGMLSAQFLEAFASSRRLEILNLSGDTVTEFGLTGTRKAWDAMRQVCDN